MLAAALLAAGGPAAEPGQAVIRTNVGNLVLNLLQEASEVRGGLPLPPHSHPFANIRCEQRIQATLQ